MQENNFRFLFIRQLVTRFWDEYFTNDNNQKLTILNFSIIVKIKWSEKSSRLLVRQIFASFHHPFLELTMAYCTRTIQIMILNFVFEKFY